MGGRVWRGAAVVAVLAVVAAGCGRSGDDSGSGDESTSTTAKAVAAAGDFGDLKAVCGPGDAKGATEKGVTDTEIQVSTFSDPGATVQPGLNQELFETSDAFTKWCNAAGGILGRKIVDHKQDAKLFEAAARMAEACTTDFMSVGGGIVFDDQTTDARVACGLAEVPAYITSQK